MDTSIIVVIAIVVVFAVAVPAMIRKSATELSRVEIDTVPDEATVISAEAQNPCRNEEQRTAVFQPGGTRKPTVPRPNVAPQSQAPALRLSAPAPEFAVIDGLADDSAATDPDAEADAAFQPSALPVAVGESRPLLGSTIHEAAVGSSADGSAGNVRMLHPAVQAVFNQGPSGTGTPGPGGAGHSGSVHSGPAHGAPASSGGSTTRGASSTRRVPRAAEAAASSRGHASASRGGDRHGGGASESTERGPRNSNPKLTADEEHSMTEKAAQLRESMSSLGAMIRGFALLFLGSALGILVTGVLAMFSVVHIALVGVFLGLAVVSLVIVRTLNLRKREVKARLREAERTSSSGSKTRRSPAPAPATATARDTASTTKPQSPAARRGSATTQRQAAERATTESASAQRATAAQRPAARGDATAAKDAGVASATKTGTTASTKAGTTAAKKTGSAATKKAAQARAAMQHTATAKLAREEADTGEIPLVRVRNEAAEGHTTRQVLLTGPIPIVKEQAAEADTAPETATSADSASEGSAASASAGANASGELNAPGDVKAPSDAKTDEDTSSAHEDAFAARTASLGADLTPAAEPATASANEDEVQAALDAASPRVDDPFMQRLKSRDGWSPTPLPVPSYVEAAQIEHPVPEAAAADASSYEARSYESYEMQARSREDIAAQFAAELGYRPELSDSAREEGPLEHGRKATRTRKTADLGAVNDVLARRRA
ncbi:MAG: hypothetical protein ACTH2U_01140 [Brevibacterium sp.]